MLEAQRERLKKWKSECLNIGITEDGMFRLGIGIPWNFTSNAYNMQTPNVYISKEDLNDPEIMSEIMKHKITGCYISVALDDYSFLNKLANLRDLAIKDGYRLSDLSFMRKLRECRMLYLHDVHLDNLDDVIETKKEHIPGYIYCLCLNDCKIKDISSILENEKLGYSEFVVITPQGSGEKQRWEGFKEGSRRFFFREYAPKN